jgi:hypothetical protein
MKNLEINKMSKELFQSFIELAYAKGQEDLSIGRDTTPKEYYIENFEDPMDYIEWGSLVIDCPRGENPSVLEGICNGRPMTQDELDNIDIELVMQEMFEREMN